MMTAFSDRYLLKNTYPFIGKGLIDAAHVTKLLLLKMVLENTVILIGLLVPFIN